MRRIELVVPDQYIVPVTEMLMASGVFHPIKSSTKSVGETTREKECCMWREWAAAFSSLERRIAAVMEALNVEEGPVPEEITNLGEQLYVQVGAMPKPASAEAETEKGESEGMQTSSKRLPYVLLLAPDVAQSEMEQVERQAQRLVAELKEAQDRYAELWEYVRHMEFVSNVNADLDALRNLRYLYMLPGTIPLDRLDRFEDSLGHIPYVLAILHRDQYLATVILFGLQRDAEVLERAARSAYLRPIRLPDRYTGTPKEVLASLHRDIQEVIQKIAKLQKEIDRLREVHAYHLRYLLWRVRASHKLAETIANYGRLHNTYLVTGWVPTSSVDQLRQVIGQISDEIGFDVRPPNPETDGPVPVIMDNPRYVAAFQGLVTTYGYPAYGEIDPTLLLAITFPLIFGLMFGDVGHGLLLALVGGFLASSKVRSLRKWANAGIIVLACGLATMLFGFLYGSIFGFEDVLPALWKRPLEHINEILITSVEIGVGLLTLGMLCNIINAISLRRWGYLLFDHYALAGLIFYWSALGLMAVMGGLLKPLGIGATPFVILLIVSGLAMAFAELLERLLDGHRPLIEGGVAMYILQAFIELFEVSISLLSNTLSYVRMGAFAVAHGTLSMVVFIIAELASPTHEAAYWVVVVLGNLFIVGFEGMIVSIQTLRLEYYEFFSKFFYGGGSRFRPLTLTFQDE